MRRIHLALALGLSALGCASSPSIADPPEPLATTATEVPAASPVGVPAQLPALASESDVDAWLHAPCVGWSASKNQLACVVADLDMGFVSAKFVLLDVSTGEVAHEQKIYEGRVAIETDKIDQSALTAAQSTLRDDGFVAGTPIAAGSITSADANFSVTDEQVTLKGLAPTFTSPEAPDGFTGDPNACMRWKGEGGQRFGSVGVIRIASTHSFVHAAGQPCHLAEELNDETFPGTSRWLVLRSP